MSNYNYNNIILKHKKSVLKSRSEADISAFLGKNKFKVPVVAANMPSILTVDICKKFDESNWFYVYPRSYKPSEVAQFVADSQDTFSIVSISIGITQEWFDLLKYIRAFNYRVDYITVDVALAYTDHIIPIVDYIKTNFKKTFLIVGNVATGEAIPWMENLGIDCAKINVGVSKSCRTKEFTGFSCVPIKNIIECSKAAKNILLMSDGGLTVDNHEVHVGDIAKSIRFGADWVMSGAIFAGCYDTPSAEHGYYGNSTHHAKGHNKHVEGTNVTIHKHKSVRDMMQLVEDSLRSSVSYSGGTTLSAIKYVDWEFIQ